MPEGRGAPDRRSRAGKRERHRLRAGRHGEYRWDEASGTLTVTFTQIPQWIDCGSIEQRLRQAVRSCGGG